MWPAGIWTRRPGTNIPGKDGFGYMQRQLALHDMYNFSCGDEDEHGVRGSSSLRCFYINQDLGRVGVVRADVTDVVRRSSARRRTWQPRLVCHGTGQCS